MTALETHPPGRHAGRLLAAAGAMTLLLAGAPLAYADYVDNTITTDVDAAAETLGVVAGATASTTIYVKNQPSAAGDTNNACNLAGSASITLAVSSSNTGKATVSPAQITIDDCGEAAARTVTVTGVAAGASTISVSPVGTVPTGTWVYDTATFTASVTAAPPPADTTAPVIDLAVSGTLGTDVGTSAPDVRGWFMSDVGIDWTVADAQSSVSSTSGCEDQVIATDGTHALSCSATSTGGTSSRSVTVKRDATAPTATPSDVDDTTWRNTPLTQEFTFADATSGLAAGQGLDSDGKVTLEVSDESADPSTPTVVTKTVEDVAGNERTRSVSALIDLTDPTDVSFVGGPADGGVYFPNTVPDPTCTATDALSGLDACVVTGRSTSVGSHTLTATATDKAGNTATETLTYRVRTLTLSGFFQPVDMSGVLNTAKAGATVPLKFRVFDEGVEQTATSVVSSFRVGAVACGSVGTATDDIEQYTSGSTTLRYDSTGAQFVQNWQTPKAPGSCYRVTMTTIDASSITGYFKLK